MATPEEIRAAVWAHEIEPGITAGQIWRAVAAVLAGRRDGLPQRPVVYYDSLGNEIVVTGDAFDDEYFDPLYFVRAFFGAPLVEQGSGGPDSRYGGRDEPLRVPRRGTLGWGDDDFPEFGGAGDKPGVASFAPASAQGRPAQRPASAEPMVVVAGDVRIEIEPNVAAQIRDEEDLMELLTLLALVE